MRLTFSWWIFFKLKIQTQDINWKRLLLKPTTSSAFLFNMINTPSVAVKKKLTWNKKVKSLKFYLYQI